MIWPSDRLNSDQLLSKLQPKQLETLALARQTKLGGYFELLVYTLFELSSEYEILAFNQVINNAQRTLGEMDLMLKHQSGEVVHLELALKFYLWAPSQQQNTYNWVGAGLTDFFEKKLARLANHQLELYSIAKRSNCWPNLPAPDRALLWIPGRLFLPANLSLACTELEFNDAPWQINPDALTSQWFHQNEVNINPEHALVKGDWLTGNSSNPKAAMKRYQLPMQFQHQENSPVFILPTNWQNKAELIISHMQT
jgi:hypothetical protein